MPLDALWQILKVIYYTHYSTFTLNNNNTFTEIIFRASTIWCIRIAITTLPHILNVKLQQLQYYYTCQMLNYSNYNTTMNTQSAITTLPHILNVNLQLLQHYYAYPMLITAITTLTHILMQCQITANTTLTHIPNGLLHLFQSQITAITIKLYHTYPMSNYSNYNTNTHT